MRFKKIIRNIHLWFGLSSGLIVVFLGLTGCILAFEVEIRNWTEDFRKVIPENRSFLPPSQLKTIANKHLTSGMALGIEYPGKDKAAIDKYNNAVNEMNAGGEQFNKTSEYLNKYRSDTINFWNNAVKQFLDRHIPVAD